MSHLGVNRKQQEILLLAEKFGIRQETGQYLIVEPQGYTFRLNSGTVKSLVKRGFLVVSEVGLLVPSQMEMFND
jgi:hypothetical protein